MQFLNLKSNKEKVRQYNHLLYLINVLKNTIKLNSFRMNDVAICLDKQGLNLIWLAYFAIISGNDKVQIYQKRNDLSTGKSFSIENLVEHQK